MSVTEDPLDLLVVLELLLKLLVVLDLLFLTGKQGVQRVTSLRLPYSNVSVFTTRNYVSVVHGIEDGINLLHSLGVVHLSRSSIVEGEDSYCLVERGCHEFTTCRSKINI